MYQVTSRGCSRAYLICVLWRGLEHVRKAFSRGQSISFPFSDLDINVWLVEARNDCCDVNFQVALGGVDYFPEDPSTFWTLASQFNTWWKNNMERKAKFVTLLKDTMYRGIDDKQHARALYCKLAVLISCNIKNHFTRVLNQQPNDDKRVRHVTLPPVLPPHMTLTIYSNHSSRYLVIANPDEYLLSLFQARVSGARNKALLATYAASTGLRATQDFIVTSGVNSSCTSTASSVSSERSVKMTRRRTTLSTVNYSMDDQDDDPDYLNERDEEVVDKPRSMLMTSAQRIASTMRVPCTPPVNARAKKPRAVLKSRHTLSGSDLISAMTFNCTSNRRNKHSKTTQRARRKSSGMTSSDSDYCTDEDEEVELDRVLFEPAPVAVTPARKYRKLMVDSSDAMDTAPVARVPRKYVRKAVGPQQSTVNTSSSCSTKAAIVTPSTTPRHGIIPVSSAPVSSELTLDTSEFTSSSHNHNTNKRKHNQNRAGAYSPQAVSQTLNTVASHLSVASSQQTTVNTQRTDLQDTRPFFDEFEMLHNFSPTEMMASPFTQSAHHIQRNNTQQLYQQVLSHFPLMSPISNGKPGPTNNNTHNTHNNTHYYHDHIDGYQPCEDEEEDGPRSFDHMNHLLNGDFAFIVERDGLDSADEEEGEKVYDNSFDVCGGDAQSTQSQQQEHHSEHCMADSGSIDFDHARIFNSNRSSAYNSCQPTPSKINTYNSTNNNTNSSVNNANSMTSYIHNELMNLNIDTTRDTQNTQESDDLLTTQQMLYAEAVRACSHSQYENTESSTPLSSDYHTPNNSEVSTTSSRESSVSGDDPVVRSRASTVTSQLSFEQYHSAQSMSNNTNISHEFAFTLGTALLTNMSNTNNNITSSNSFQLNSPAYMQTPLRRQISDYMQLGACDAENANGLFGVISGTTTTSSTSLNNFDLQQGGGNEVKMMECRDEVSPPHYSFNFNKVENEEVEEMTDETLCELLTLYASDNSAAVSSSGEVSEEEEEEFSGGHCVDGIDAMCDSWEHDSV